MSNSDLFKSHPFIHSIIFILLTFILSHSQILAQLVEVKNSSNTISEGKIYKDKNGVLYTDAIVVNFNENVVDLPIGERFASKENIKTNYSEISNLLNDLITDFGKHKLIKQIPSAKWGDTKRVNKITGKEISVHDFSQLFTVKFDTPVPLESVIDRFEELKEVEYVHQPITIAFHTDSPNDYYYSQSNQWYLFAIGAEGAWDITTGSSNIKIGIIDS